jgi:transcriptional regulator with XRE-family HTH domain
VHVIAIQPRYIGKETDRKWEQGGDFSLICFKPAQFDGMDKMASADPALIEQFKARPIKELARQSGVDRNTIRKLLRGVPVRRATLRRIAEALRSEEKRATCSRAPTPIF